MPQKGNMTTTKGIQQRATVKKEEKAPKTPKTQGRRETRDLSTALAVVKGWSSKLGEALRHPRPSGRAQFTTPTPTTWISPMSKTAVWDLEHPWCFFEISHSPTILLRLVSSLAWWKDLWASNRQRNISRKLA
jgi:hypothetical protein